MNNWNIIDDNKILIFLREINFIWKQESEKNIRLENQNNLEFFINSLFKNNNIQFEKKSLKALFKVLTKERITILCNKKPNNTSFRKLWYYYEQISWEIVNYIWTKATYTNLIDENTFFCSKWIKNKKWKVNVNLLWKIKWFNPFIRKIIDLEKLITFDYNNEIKKIVNSKTQYLIEKSIDYLFIKETKSSYKIEWDEYSFNKNAKFLNALKNIKIYENFSEESLITIHNLVMSPKNKENEVRVFDNYITSWNELMWESIIEYISPKWKDVSLFINELIYFYEKNKISLPPILLASIVSSFFVFIHPFSDWNWRSSRYLFHYVLKELWFWKYNDEKNIIIPISAYILNNRDEYYYNLNKVSIKFWENIEYDINNKWEIEIYWETFDNYIYSDYTDLCLYFWNVLYKSFIIDFKEEIDFLEKYYNFINEINDLFELSNKNKWLIWKFIINWKWNISKNKLNFLEKNWVILDEQDLIVLKKVYKTIYEK